MKAIKISYDAGRLKESAFQRMVLFFVMVVQPTGVDLIPYRHQVPILEQTEDVWKGARR
jgi:hypothetical protein